MRLSTVALLTLTALVAQESATEASPKIDLSSSPNLTPETHAVVDAVDHLTIQPKISVSAPETLLSQHFSSDASISVSEPLLVAAASLPTVDAQLAQIIHQTWLGKLTQMQQGSSSERQAVATLAQIHPGATFNNEFSQTITLLNTLLMIAAFLPTVTILFFWLVRRLVVKELVAEARKRLDKIDHLETHLQTSTQRSRHLIQELESQIKTVQENLIFLSREAHFSKSSIDQIEDLKSQFILQLQGIIAEVHNAKSKAIQAVIQENKLQQKQNSVMSEPQPVHPIPQPSVHPPTPKPRAIAQNSAPKKTQTPSLQSEPFIADDYLKQGESLIHEGRYLEALNLLEKATQSNPNLDEAWYHQANVLVKLQRYSEALNAYEKTLKIKPKNYETWYNKGNVLVRLQRYGEALESYDKALELKPDDYEAWHNRGVLLRKFKRYGDALESYDKALKLKPDKYETWHNRANILAKLQRYEEAITSYDKAIIINPGKWEIWSNRAVALCMLKRYEEAIASYEQATALHPNDPELWKNQAQTLEKLNHYSDALISLEKAIKLKPDCYEAWLSQGTILEHLKRPADALAAYDQAIALKPDSHQAWRYQGRVLEKLDRASDAMSSYNTAIALNPEDAEAWRYRGALLSTLKQYPEAISSLGKAISIQKELRASKHKPPQLAVQN